MEESKRRRRRMERRRQRLESDIVDTLQIGVVRGTSLQPIAGPRVARPARVSTPQIADTTPTHLTKSGPELDAIIVFFLAGYCAVLHHRARRRSIA